MNKGAVIILLLMVIVGVAFGVGFYMYAQSMRATIYMFKADYEAGTLVEGDMFLQQEIDAETYRGMAANGEKGMYVNQDQLISYIEKGDRLAADVVAYMPVVDSMFVSTGGTGVERRLDNNKVAVEILANGVRGLSGGEVGRESRINVSTFFDVDDKRTTQLLFQNLLVLDVVRDEEGNVSSVFVEMTPEDSIVLQHALVAETVSVSILKPGSYSPITEGTEFTKYYTEQNNTPEENGSYTFGLVPSEAAQTEAE